MHVHHSTYARILYAQAADLTHLCDGTGQDGAFRPAGHRLQPGFPLRREHGLVRALKRLSHVSYFVLVRVLCTRMWPECGSATLPDFESRKSTS